MRLTLALQVGSGPGGKWVALANTGKCLHFSWRIPEITWFATHERTLSSILCWRLKVFLGEVLNFCNTRVWYSLGRCQFTEKNLGEHQHHRKLLPNRAMWGGQWSTPLLGSYLGDFSGFLHEIIWQSHWCLFPWTFLQLCYCCLLMFTSSVFVEPSDAGPCRFFEAGVGWQIGTILSFLLC